MYVHGVLVPKYHTRIGEQCGRIYVHLGLLCHPFRHSILLTRKFVQGHRQATDSLGADIVLIDDAGAHRVKVAIRVE